MADKATTRPRRQRNYPEADSAPAAGAAAENEAQPATPETTPKTPAAKKAKAKTTPDVAAKLADSPAVQVEVEGKQRFVFELIMDEATTNYQKFRYPPGCPMVGKVYAPLGTGKVRISLEAAD